MQFEGTTDNMHIVTTVGDVGISTRQFPHFADEAPYWETKIFGLEDFAIDPSDLGVDEESSLDEHGYVRLRISALKLHYHSVSAVVSELSCRGMDDVA